MLVIAMEMFYNTLNVQLHLTLTAQKDLDKRIRWIMPSLSLAIASDSTHHIFVCQSL